MHHLIRRCAIDLIRQHPVILRRRWEDDHQQTSRRHHTGKGANHGDLLSKTPERSFARKRISAATGVKYQGVGGRWGAGQSNGSAEAFRGAPTGS
jgi:hypothetical protein